MTERETWNLAVAAVAEEFARLSSPRRTLVAEAVEAAKTCKEALYSIAAAVATRVCASCGGECCLTGKYHFTVVDLLAYLVDDRELFTPRFDQDACPYLGVDGCLMAPPYRPFNCVTFNCERLEILLEPPEKERLARLEQELRMIYGRFEELTGVRIMGGLLMNGERDLVRKRGLFSVKKDNVDTSCCRERDEESRKDLALSARV